MVHIYNVIVICNTYLSRCPMYLFYFRNQTQFFKNVSKGEAYKYEAYMQRLCNRNDNEPPPLPKKPMSFKRLQYDRMLSGAITPKADFDRITSKIF